MKTRIALVALLMGMSIESQALTREYKITREDAAELEYYDTEFETERQGGDWARCTKTHCYILRTGEVITIESPQEGIYLAFPNPDYRMKP